MEELNELIKQRNLEESTEYVIIPFVTSGGMRKRCFLLKRRFIRIVHKDGRYADYALAEAIEAILSYPDMKLSEALRLIYGEEAERGRLEAVKSGSGFGSGDDTIENLKSQADA